MKKGLRTLTAVISILILILATESFAQKGIGWKGSGGWGMGYSLRENVQP